jgi:uncharacterized protein (DUF2141 family)
MKTIIASFIISLFLATGIYAGERLSLLITNINPARGKLYVAVYNSAENYMDPGSAISREIIPVTADTAFVVFDNLPAGEYAIAVFLDLNGNGMLDTRKNGIPEEPFGFSNDARSKLGPAKFRDACFSFHESRQLTIKLVSNVKKQK